MYLFPRTAAESVSCGMTAELARRGGVEYARPPVGCLDILPSIWSPWRLSAAMRWRMMEILPRAYSFRDVSREDVEGVLGMLAGDFEHERDIPVRPRILYDRIHGQWRETATVGCLVVSRYGTDSGQRALGGTYGRRRQGRRSRRGIRVLWSQKGDRFLLGAFAWRVLDISRIR